MAPRIRASAYGMQPAPVAMRDYEADPKSPRPVQVPKKGTNALEAAEASPGRLRKDDDRDRHRLL